MPGFITLPATDQAPPNAPPSSSSSTCASPTADKVDHVSQLHLYLSKRSNMYKIYPEFQYTGVSGGFTCTVIITSRTGTQRSCPSPLGTTYERYKPAKQAASAAALAALHAGHSMALHSDDVTSCAAQPAADARVAALTAITGHAFQSRELALRALRHASVGADNHDALAFLGGAAIAFLTAKEAYAGQPAAAAASKKRLVMERRTRVGVKMFEGIAARIGLTPLLEVVGIARDKVEGKMVADLFEAVVGALELEAGMLEVERFWKICLEAGVAEEDGEEGEKAAAAAAAM